MKLIIFFFYTLGPRCSVCCVHFWITISLVTISLLYLACEPKNGESIKVQSPSLNGPNQTAPKPAALLNSTPEIKSLVEGSITVQKLNQLPLDRFKLQQAKVRPLPLQGGGVFQMDEKATDDKLFLGVGRGHHQGLGKVWLVDLKTRKKIASVDGIYTSSLASRIAIVTLGKEDAIVHMDDGKIVVPKARLPGGVTPLKMRIVAAENAPLVWLFVAVSDNKVYHAQWRDLRSETVLLHETIDIWPDMASGDEFIWICSEAEQPNKNTNEDAPCRCYEFHPEQKPVCSQNMYWNQSNILSQDKAASFRNPDCIFFIANLDEPPRSLYLCEGGKEKKQRIEILTTTNRLILEETFKMPTSNTNIVKGRFIPLELLSNSDVSVHWIDLELGRFIEGPELLLGMFNKSGHKEQVLAVDAENQAILWLLDFKAGTATPIADNFYCSGIVDSLQVNDSKWVFSCLKASGVDDYFRPSERIHHYDWTEIVDLKSRTRKRTRRVFECTSTQAGTIAGTMVGKPAGFAIIE